MIEPDCVLDDLRREAVTFVHRCGLVHSTIVVQTCLTCQYRSSYTIRGRTHYACGRHLDGRACSQKIGVKRSVIEPGLLEGFRAELLSPEAIQAASEAAHRVLKNHAKTPAVDTERLDVLRTEIGNLADAVAGGALKSSPALGDRLAKAETELQRLDALQRAPTVKVLPRFADIYREWIDDLENVVSADGLKNGLVTLRDIARARAQLKDRLGGHIVVTEDDEEIRFETEAGREEVAIRLASGESQVCMVAGGRFTEMEHLYTVELERVA